MQHSRLELSACSNPMAAATGGHHQHDQYQHHDQQLLHPLNTPQPHYSNYLGDDTRLDGSQSWALEHGHHQHLFGPPAAEGLQMAPGFGPTAVQPSSPPAAVGHSQQRPSLSPQSIPRHHHQTHHHSHRSHDPSDHLHLQASSNTYLVHKQQRHGQSHGRAGHGHLATAASAARLKHLAANFAQQQHQTMALLGDSRPQEPMQIDQYLAERSPGTIYQPAQQQVAGKLHEQVASEAATTLTSQSPAPLIDGGGLVVPRPAEVCGEHPPAIRPRVSSISIASRASQAAPTTPPTVFPTRSMSFSSPGSGAGRGSIGANYFNGHQLQNSQPTYSAAPSVPSFGQLNPIYGPTSVRSGDDADNNNNNNNLTHQQSASPTDGFGQQLSLQTSSGHSHFGGSISSAGSSANSPTPPMSSSYSPTGVGNYLAGGVHYNGGHPGCTAAGGGPISASDALSLGINLEQYISKRNERERSRVRNVNDAFDNLKNSLPLDSEKLAKRMSKVEILRTAINYIRDLEVILGSKQHHSTSEQTRIAEAKAQELQNQLDQLQQRLTPSSTEPTDNSMYSNNDNNYNDNFTNDDNNNHHQYFKQQHHSPTKGRNRSGNWSSASSATSTSSSSSLSRATITNTTTAGQMEIRSRDNNKTNGHGCGWQGNHDQVYQATQLQELQSKPESKHEYYHYYEN